MMLVSGLKKTWYNWSWMFPFRPPLPWRHNGRDGVSNHQPHSCLLNRLFKAQITENIKAPRHWPLWGEFIGDRWIPHTKGQLRGKLFHLMTSSWHAHSRDWANETILNWGTWKHKWKKYFCIVPRQWMYNLHHNTIVSLRENFKYRMAAVSWIVPEKSVRLKRSNDLWMSIRNY